MTFEEWINEPGWSAGTRGDNFVEDLAHGCRAKDIINALEEAYQAGFQAGFVQILGTELPESPTT